jgi:hypothetical protein
MPIGTLINSFAIIVGGLTGMVLNDKIPEKLKTVTFQGLGLAAVLIGLQMALKVENILVLIFSLILGGIIGETLSLEKRLETFGSHLKTRLKSDNPKFIEGFVAASILFCVGAMAILGPIDEGLTGNRTILLTKSILDGFAAIALASTYGLGVIFSALPIFIYQGLITVFAGKFQTFLSATVINQLTACGGLLIMAIGFGLLEIKKIKVTSMLPALILVVLFTLLITKFTPTF